MNLQKSCNWLICGQYISLIFNNKKHAAGIYTLGVRYGRKNASTWSNLLKYNLCDTIKKWYLFSDLGVVCTTNKKQGHPKGMPLFFYMCRSGVEPVRKRVRTPFKGKNGPLIFRLKLNKLMSYKDNPKGN